jgi:hypothetical protein
VNNNDKNESDSLIDYLNGLPKRSPLNVMLPDSEYNSRLEKAQMAKV